MDYNKLITVLKWRIAITEPEFISAPSYTKHYIGFDKISQKELDEICYTINMIFQINNSKYRVLNSMGEIIPAIIKQGIK